MKKKKNKGIDFTKASDKKIEEYIENNDLKDWTSATKKEKEKLVRVANTHIKERKNKTLNMRISERDLNALKAIALEEGLNYQALVTSVLHKYLNNQLVDIKNLKSIIKELKKAF